MAFKWLILYTFAKQASCRRKISSVLFRILTDKISQNISTTTLDVLIFFSDICRLLKRIKRRITNNKIKSCQEFVI